MTLEAVERMELKENSGREWVQDNTLKVLQVIEKNNVGTIFHQRNKGYPSFLSSVGIFAVSSQ